LPQDYYFASDTNENWLSDDDFREIVENLKV